MPKVAHLTSVHDSRDARIFYKECRTLAMNGYKVILAVTDGKGEEGSIDGVSIVTVNSKNNSRLSRMIAGSVGFLKAAIRFDADIYHIHDPELLVVGLALRIKGKRVIYDAHEDFSAQVRSKYWIPRKYRRLASVVLGNVEKKLGSVMSGVVVANPGHANRFPSGKTIVVQNFPMLSEAENLADRPYFQRSHDIVYVGGLSRGRGVVQMVQAMSYLPPSLNARLHLGGNFESKELLDEVSRMPAWRNVTYHGWVDRADLVGLVNRSRVGLVLVHPEPNYLHNQPVKLFEYMLAGIPVVASNILNYSQFVEDMGTGLMVDPLKPQEIARAITWLLENPTEAKEMGVKGREAALQHFNWGPEGDKLTRFYEQILTTV